MVNSAVQTRHKTAGGVRPQLRVKASDGIALCLFSVEIAHNTGRFRVVE